jgi:hypothetical protein
MLLRIRHDREAVALSHDVLVGVNGHNLHRQGFKSLPLILGEREDAPIVIDASPTNPEENGIVPLASTQPSSSTASVKNGL